MDIFKLCGFVILAVVLCLVVRGIHSESAVGVRIAAGVFVGAAVISLLAPALDAVSELAEAANIDGETAKILLKALAICYATALCADCARDAGESALGSKLELAGRAAIAVVSLPIFTSLADLAARLLNN